MKHAAIYSRVSTTNQDTASQDRELKRWAAAQDEPVKWYSDRFTGKTMNRPGWMKIEDGIDRGNVSRVVVWRLDRLGRTARGLTALFEKLVTNRVGFVSLKDGVDLATPAGRMVANVLASIAQFETEVRAERVLAGQATARERGVVWGGSKKGRQLHVTDEQIRSIRDLAGRGEKVTSIARATGLSRPTVYHWLRSADHTA